MQLAGPPPSPCPTEPIAAPSRRAVHQLTAPGQLDEEQRTGVVVVVHTAASYRASCVCDRVSYFCARDSRAGVRAMQVASEEGCAESAKSVAGASASAAIIEEK